MKYRLIFIFPVLIFAYLNESTITPNDNCGAPPRYLADEYSSDEGLENIDFGGRVSNTIPIR